MLQVEVRERLQSRRLANSLQEKGYGGSAVVAAEVVVGSAIARLLMLWGFKPIPPDQLTFSLNVNSGRYGSV